jgi:hypothetical protein
MRRSEKGLCKGLRKVAVRREIKSETDIEKAELLPCLFYVKCDLALLQLLISQSDRPKGDELL